MIKLLRYLKKRDWFLIVIILALAFLQVYCMRKLQCDPCLLSQA